MHTIVAEYLKPKKNMLAELYQWDFKEKIPMERFDIQVTGGNWYEKNIDLNRQLCAAIVTDSSARNIEDVIDYFIKTWGGIPRYSQIPDLVNKFINVDGGDSKPSDFTFNFKSISSWSKGVSLLHPKWACIYDTRVAYSLNAINFINGSKFKVFPMPDGRNTRLKMLDASTLLVSKKIQTDDDIDPKKIRKNHFISESLVFVEYLNLVKKVSKQLWGDDNHIHEVEMLLFSLADGDIYKSVFTEVAKLNNN